MRLNLFFCNLNSRTQMQIFHFVLVLPMYLNCTKFAIFKLPLNFFQPRDILLFSPAQRSTQLQPKSIFKFVQSFFSQHMRPNFVANFHFCNIIVSFKLKLYSYEWCGQKKKAGKRSSYEKKFSCEPTIVLIFSR